MNPPPSSPAPARRVLKHYGEKCTLKLSATRKNALRRIAEEHGVVLQGNGSVKPLPGWRAAVLAIADGKIATVAPPVPQGGRGSRE